MSKIRDLFETESEWRWFLRLGKSKTSPEEKKAFFDGVIEQKMQDKNWSLFSAFPKDDGLSICREIISELKAVNEAKRVEEKSWLPPRNSELAEWGKKLGEHIDAELERNRLEALEKGAG